LGTIEMPPASIQFEKFADARNHKETIGENLEDDRPQDRGGKTLWSGLASGDETRCGRSYKLENYYEVLSDAIVNTVSSLLESAEFQKASSDR
jgi:hypothetical protein